MDDTLSKADSDGDPANMAGPADTAVAPSAAPPASPPPPPARPVSDWSPLLHPVFRSLWIASAVSYTGFEIRNYAAPLLMGDFQVPFNLSEGMKQYTFAASTLPIPLLVLFAGALADRVDRRKLLVVTHLWMMLAAGALGVITMANLMTPWMLLAFLFAIGAGYAMMNPALLAVLPELVEPRELKSAMALNSVNMNIARVAGPAIGGVLIVAIAGNQPYYIGKGLAFLATGVSLIGVVYVLLRWKPAPRKAAITGESVLQAAWKGLHYAFTSSRLLQINARIFLFMVCAGILPTVCAVICKQHTIELLGETGASYMMACFGVGAIIGVYFMQGLQRRFGVEKVVVVCTVLYGLAMLGVARMSYVSIGCAAMFVAGFNWVIVPTNFNIATQLAVPAWIKGRAMGVYVLVLWGSMFLGSIISGRLATIFANHNLDGQRWSLFTSGVGVIVGAIAIIWLRLEPKHVESQTSSTTNIAGK
jgi:MFS family permease